MQKQFVPEAQNDMIFSIICEELGLFGAICILIMFLLLLWRLLFIATHAKDQMGSFLAIGILVHISLQVILNVAVVTNTIPNTGITLPFISYGGSALIMLLAELGIALSVSAKRLSMSFCAAGLMELVSFTGREVVFFLFHLSSPCQ